jgi:hypothetical protein
MTINKVLLKKPYFTKKIEPTAFKTVLGSTHQTAYRLYLIRNEIEELQHFINVKHPDLWVSATVKTVAAPAGLARQQVWSVKHLKPILEKKPRFELKCSVTDKMSNKEIYRCEQVSINETTIYQQIQECINDLNQIINEKTN